MVTKSKQRQRLVDRITKLPDEKLVRLESYVTQLEGNEDVRSKALDFAGIFSDLDSEVFDDLTENLHANRLRDYPNQASL